MVIALIPARMASVRFPGKPLALLAGRPVIQHVYHAVQAVRGIAQVYVATDDDRIAGTVRAFGGQAVMTRADHPSGTDRILEALRTVDPANAVRFVVNVQGDEPLIRPAYVERCLAALRASADGDWATLIYPLASDHDARNPNLVKVVCDTAGGALYFSRAAIPFERDGRGAARRYGHMGLYVYRSDALRRFAALAPTPLEQTEKLEQLRALEAGMSILCVEVPRALPGIDTPADLAQAEALLTADPSLSNLQS
jgi:3-deoxy-manno-octulosonate cytidylyltransferase (CMP-KDO synthetase)